MQAILFDIDGTLILTGGAGQRAFAQTLADEFGVPEITSDIKFSGRSDRAIACDVMRAHGIEPSEANWQRFRTGYLSRLPAALRSGQGRVLPGVNALLDRLAMMPVQVGLLTGNIREGARHKLTHYQLWDRFAFGGFGDDHLDRKDIAGLALAAARERFAKNGEAAKRLETIIVVGDTESDIRCARAIGARAVAVATGFASAEALAAERPDLLLESLEEVFPLFDWLAPRLPE